MVKRKKHNKIMNTMNLNIFNDVKRIALCAIMLTISACSTTPPARFYTLHINPADVQKRESAKPETSLRIGVGPLNLPRYLDRLQIVTRDEQDQLVLAEFDQWAEPLSDAMVREVTQGLSRAFNHHAFYAYPWNAFGAMDYRIVINIMQFDGQLGDHLETDVRWVVIDEKTNKTIVEAQAQWQLTMDAADYASVNRAMNASVTKMVEEIAGRLKQLNEHSVVSD